MTPASQRTSIVVEAPARLHLGFIDLHGGLGRRYGSLGLALDTPLTRLRLQRREHDAVHGPQAQRAAASLRRLQECYRLGPAALEIEEAIPPHAGLGSGTQLALAVGSAAAAAWGLDLGARQLAQLLDRGARSGIGIGCFELGGFVVDGGRGAGDEPPPLLSRIPFPEAWRVLLLFDHASQGLHGAAEIEAFRRLPPFPAEQAAHLARLVLMQMLPALAEGEFRPFGLAVSELQRVTGDHFAGAQGGRYTSPRVARALALLEAEGVCCVGQSSWGPTGFAVAESAQQAQDLVHILEARRGPGPGLDLRIARGCNRGARIEREEALVRLAQGGA